MWKSWINDYNLGEKGFINIKEKKTKINFEPFSIKERNWIFWRFHFLGWSDCEVIFSFSSQRFCVWLEKRRWDECRVLHVWNENFKTNEIVDFWLNLFSYNFLPFLSFSRVNMRNNGETIMGKWRFSFFNIELDKLYIRLWNLNIITFMLNTCYILLSIASYLRYK